MQIRLREELFCNAPQSERGFCGDRDEPLFVYWNLHYDRMGPHRERPVLLLCWSVHHVQQPDACFASRAKETEGGIDNQQSGAHRLKKSKFRCEANVVVQLRRGDVLGHFLAKYADLAAHTTPAVRAAVCVYIAGCSRNVTGKTGC